MTTPKPPSLFRLALEALVPMAILAVILAISLLARRNGAKL